MTYNFWLQGQVIDAAKLPENGFERIGDAFCKRIDMLNGIYISIKIKCADSPDVAPQLFVDVFDAHIGKKCNRFYNGHGGAALKTEVRQKVSDSLKNCLIIQ